MRNLIDGCPARDTEAGHVIGQLNDRMLKTLAGPPLDSETVIRAAGSLALALDPAQIRTVLAARGIEGAAADHLIEDTICFLGADYLRTKIGRELGHPLYETWEAAPGIWEQYRPLGVLTHIAAGNAAGLPAVSVLEGLLTGNINLLKLPEGDDGLSTLLLSRMIEIEPRLAPYIYVFDISSRDTGRIRALLEASDAVAVWGSDAAVSAVRSYTPPGAAVIEWGHRISFGYVTEAGESGGALRGLARDICTTEQLLCSAPQCVFYDTDDREALLGFARRFAEAMADQSPRYASPAIDIHARAEITSSVLLAGMEEILGEKAVIRDPDLSWGVLVDYESGLCPSPMYRHVWVRPLRRDQILPVLRPCAGHLQTVGLACADSEQDGIASLLFRAGVTRVTPCGGMNQGYAGEPHDGTPALRRYVRQVSLRRGQ